MIADTKFKAVCPPATIRLLIGGFGALLLLMVALILLSKSNLRSQQQQLDRVVSDHMAKVALSHTMHTHTRGRTTGLLRLLLNEDPFEQDQELLRFSQHAAYFTEARNTLTAMQLSDTEKNLLALQAQATLKAIPLQQKVIRLVEQARYQEAHRVLNEETIPAQDAVIAAMDKFYAFQLDAARQAQLAASEQAARDETLVMLIGISAVILGVVISILVIRTIRQRGARDAYLATHDPLTGLPNRTLLMDRLEQIIKRHERQEGSLALLFIDIDKFKHINDTYGHAAGDQVLKEATRRIARQLRNSDTLTRLSGDEFVALLDNAADRQAIEATAQRVVDSCAQGVRVAGQDIPISVSIGIALYPEHGRNADTLLSHGDIAMYDSKRQGRNCWQVYQANLNAGL